MSNAKQKKTEQLGMNPGTASGRLVKDILYSLIQHTELDMCCKCGDFMSRDDFSIEHTTPWLDSDNPVDLYFDLSNISFSHQSCNYSAARKSNQKYFSEEEKRLAKNNQNRLKYESLPEEVRKSKRREKYLRTGN